MNHLQQTGIHGLNVIRTSLSGRVADYSPDGMHMNAALADFDVNGTDLKSNHEIWLEKAILRMNTSHRSFIWQIRINGGASLTGINVLANNGLNYWLASQRAAEVEKFLKARVTIPGAVYRDVGTLGVQLPSYLGHPVGVENDNDRAVFIQITCDSTLPPPPRLPVSIPLSPDFAVRFIKGSSAGAFVLGIDAIDFEIADTKNHQYALYRYNGDSVGVALSFGVISVSYTFKGSWTDFHLAPPDTLNVVDFDGSARFSTGGGPFTSISWNYLTITPAGGAKTTDSPLKVDTGRTLGGGLSVGFPGTGWLHFCAGPWPFTGAYPA